MAPRNISLDMLLRVARHVCARYTVCGDETAVLASRSDLKYTRYLVYY